MSKNDQENNSNHIVFGLYGAGGFAREVMPLVFDYIALTTQSNPELTHSIYFVETSPKKSEVNGTRLISEKDFFEIECSERLFNVAIGDSKARERIANECLAKGAKPMTIQSPHSITYCNNEIGDGAVLCANTMITSNTKIGRFFHANIYSYVAHDCEIGDFVTFAPNVHCNGNVHIHNHAYIGTGAVIKQGTSEKPIVIGEGAIVGMGAVVTKDVPPYTTVVGNPAKPHVKN
jgi:sugar O-acyltransferase (sialic acid O-acetyltransferase NeuD family)